MSSSNTSVKKGSKTIKTASQESHLSGVHQPFNIKPSPVKDWHSRITKEDQLRRQWERDYGNFIYTLNKQKEAAHGKTEDDMKPQMMPTKHKSSICGPSFGPRPKVMPTEKYTIPVTSNMVYGWKWQYNSLEVYGSTNAKTK